MITRKEIKNSTAIILASICGYVLSLPPAMVLLMSDGILEMSAIEYWYFPVIFILKNVLVLKAAYGLYACLFFEDYYYDMLFM